MPDRTAPSGQSSEGPPMSLEEAQDILGDAMRAPAPKPKEDAVPSRQQASQSSSPTATDVLYDDSGNACWWRADAYSKDELCDPDGEWDYLELTPDKLREQWHACRWTTAEERADEDWVYEQFGDVEMTPADTSVVYWHCKPDAPGAVLYWTTEG